MLERCSPRKPALIGEYTRFTFGELLKLSASVKNVYRFKNIAISFLDPVLGLATAFSLNGKARSLLLIPSDLHDAGLAFFLKEANADIVVTDFQRDGEEQGALNTLIWSDLFTMDSCDTAPNVFDTKWLFLTSGSTGAPKIVSHCFDALLKSAYVKNEATKVWSSLFDPMRFAGIQLFLHCVSTCSTMVVPRQSSRLVDKATFIAKQNCDAISATPSALRALMTCLEFNRLELDQITISGEVITDDLLEMLKKRFYKAKLTHIYASTEGGVGFVVSDGIAGIPISLFERLADVVKISQGSLWVRGGRTALEIGELTRDPDSWLDTQDLVEVKGERIFVLGRLSNSINVGGQKVRPEEIESWINRFPGVSITKVYAKTNPILGEVVVADVALEQSHSINGEDFVGLLREFLSDNLEGYKVPAVIRIVDELKLSRNGKIERR